MNKFIKLALILGLILATAWSAAHAADPLDLEWKDLMPPKIKLSDILKKHNITVRDVNRMKDSNPEEKKVLDEIRSARNYIPVYHNLDGRKVRIPGFVVPLQTSERITEFLLVPFFGACIHVPPPPANQIIYVRTKKEIANDMFLPVRVTGVLKIEDISSDLAESSYSMEAIKIVPIDVDREKGIRTHGQ